MNNRRIGPNLRALIVSLCAGVTVACASAPAIPLRGSPDAFAALVGEWDGWDTGRDADRSGSIGSREARDRRGSGRRTRS